MALNDRLEESKEAHLPISMRISHSPVWLWIWMLMLLFSVPA